MPSFKSILATSALASLAFAKPIPSAKPKSFVVNQVVQKATKLSGPQALKNAYLKHGKAVPDNVLAAADNGNVAANPEQYDSEYLCQVNIGGQTLNLDFDTGSADLWVFSTLQPSSETQGHEIYNPNDSSTAQQIQGATWNISYGDGSSASGVVYTDTVNVGGTVVPNQAVEAAEQISSQFEQDTNNDGLLGLAFSSINTVQPTQQNTFFDNAVQEGIISQPLFTADLKHGQPGSYGFGAIDDSQYTGDITYTSVDNSQGFWGFSSDGYAVGSGDFQSESVAGIADTGTTLLLLPDDQVSAYYAQVDGAQNDSSQGGYVFDCSTDLPSFTVGIGGSQYTIPGDYLNYAPTADGSSTCFGGLQSSDQIGTNIYGDIFLKSVFAVFNSGNLQLGFATKNL